MKSVISLLFGPTHSPTGWAGEEDLPAIPLVGQSLVIDFENSPAGSIRGTIYRTWDDSDTGITGILIYAGAQPPSAGVPEALSSSGWEPISRDTALHLSRVVEETPVIAAVHEVVLAVGGVFDADKTVYRRRLNPMDPVLPLVGQRLLLDATDTEDDGDDFEESWVEGSQYEKKIDGYLFGSGHNDVSEGLPVVTVHASELQPGEARILMWTPTLGGIPEDSLFARGWVKTSPEDRCLDPDFRLSRRVELALHTRLTLSENDYSSVTLGDWVVTNPDMVEDGDRELLPVLLWEQTFAAREIQNIGDIMEQWKDSPGSSEPAP